ncbi:MAG: hypothetical protein AAB355_03290 [Patescibacteria group bacterium]
MKELLSKVVFPPAVTSNVLESAREVAEILSKSQTGASVVEILEIQGYELGIKEGLSLEEYKELMNNLYRHSKVQAKAREAYEVAALAEVEKVATLEEGAALAERLYHNGKARDRLGKRCIEFRLAEAAELLAGPDEFWLARRAYALLPNHACSEGVQALEKLTRSVRSFNECLEYLKEMSPRTSRVHFDKVFNRGLGLCKTREELQRLKRVFCDKKKFSWSNNEEEEHYRNQLDEAIAAHNRSLLPNAKSFDELMKLKCESSGLSGLGPVSRELNALIFGRAVELADLQQLHGLLSGSHDWCKDKALEAWGRKKWETLSRAETEETSDSRELIALLKYLPPEGTARKNCLAKIVQLQDSPEEALAFSWAYRDEKIAGAARNRYEELLRVAMQSACTPQQIMRALKACEDNLPDIRKEGIAKLAAFYRIPKANVT